MGLDITIKEMKEFRCPDCGRLVTIQEIDNVSSGGRVWYDFLKSVGYYVPHGEPIEGKDWYGEDMVLTEEQVKQLTQFISRYRPSVYHDIEDLVANALTYGNKVVINADW